MTGAPVPDFDEAFQAKFTELLVRRRDVRHFLTRPLPSGCIERLLGLACLAPSVGLSQPWRFVLVDDPARRKAVRDNFMAANAEALASYQGERAAIYAKLNSPASMIRPCSLPSSPNPNPNKARFWAAARCRRQWLIPP